MGAAGGYRFIPYCGAELGYLNLGKESAPLSSTSGTVTSASRLTIRGPTLALVGAAQIRNFEAFLRVGYLLANTRATAAGVLDGTTKFNATVSANTPAPFGGAGLRYAFSDHWHLKLEFDHYKDVGNAATTGKTHISVTTLGIGCRF